VTNFTKENLVKDGDSLFYIDESWNRQFVARFKYAAKSSIGPFATLLRKNFTVEEFFAQREAGKTPQEIAESKGFVLSHIKKWLKRDGFTATQEGYRQWLAWRREEQKAKLAA